MLLHFRCWSSVAAQKSVERSSRHSNKQEIVDSMCNAFRLIRFASFFGKAEHFQMRNQIQNSFVRTKVFIKLQNVSA